MTESADDEERSFTVTRTIEAPPKRVFEAFLDPDDLAVWAPPPGFEAEVEDVEPEEGGTFRIWLEGSTEETEPHSHPFTGTFQELTKPEKIVFTDESMVEQLGEDARYTATVTFKEVPDGTEVTALFEGIPEFGGVDQATARWDAAFEKLANQVES
ncbi:SRPBCC domain-containing protein [Halosolutus gelatinilyticus]|uniref:SRPBCC domain-containing protein n=1 Tax=Halosolutus gelatinilyticus TaxID=2931975 RepID=UPI001FF6BDD2|nr:SRPBCC domain-containing protein [Halosolutus gelatinilyticus]